MKKILTLTIILMAVLIGGCVTASGKLIDSDNLELYKNINEEMILQRGKAAVYLNVVVTGYSTTPSMKILIDGQEVKLNTARWNSGRSNYSANVFSAGSIYYASVSETKVYNNSIALTDEVKEAILNAETMTVTFSTGNSEMYSVNLTKTLPQIKTFLSL